MILIAVTPPEKQTGEAERIKTMLRGGIDLIHLRKPGWDEAKIAALIEEIPDSLHRRIKLHDHFRLCGRYNLGGIHLNSRAGSAEGLCGSISRSCHSCTEAEANRELDYVTLSPIFPSISKTGYRGNFSDEELKAICAQARVVALGGVTPEKLPVLSRLGFFGAAMLGYLSDAADITQLKERLSITQRFRSLCCNS